MQMPEIYDARKKKPDLDSGTAGSPTFANGDWETAAPGSLFDMMKNKVVLFDSTLKIVNYPEVKEVKKANPDLPADESS